MRTSACARLLERGAEDSQCADMCVCIEEFLYQCQKPFMFDIWKFADKLTSKGPLDSLAVSR